MLTLAPLDRGSKLQLTLAVLLLGGVAWLSVQVYRSSTNPEVVPFGAGPYAWLIGPSADALVDSASEQVQAGLAVLNDTALPPVERLRSYREHLETAEELLIRSLRAQPAQARALAQLAVVQWELSPPRTEVAEARYVHMIELASAMAPTVPKIQVQLGELVLRMGRRVDALAYFVRAVDLDPEFSRRVVQALSDHLVPPGEILDALPDHPEVLLALGRVFPEKSRDAEYLELVEATLLNSAGRIHTGLLTGYANTCLRLGQAGRLRARVEALGTLTDSTEEAMRRFHRARALLALDRKREAAADAKRALELQPGDPRIAEFAGTTLAGSGDHDGAIDAYRLALRALAQGSANPIVRARLYRKIGQSEESRGAPARAYDSYGLALELDPDEAFAKQRFTEMQRAAGVLEP